MKAGAAEALTMICLGRPDIDPASGKGAEGVIFIGGPLLGGACFNSAHGVSDGRLVERLVRLGCMFWGGWKVRGRSGSVQAPCKLLVALLSDGPAPGRGRPISAIGSRQQLSAMILIGRICG
jgi:hypothetical protein